jgi:hypothetical protein
MNLPGSFINIILGIAILIGALECFFGYRIFRIILGLIGFLIGAILGAAIGYSLSGDRIVSLLAGVVGGVIGASLLVALYFVGVFIVGALLGGVLSAMLYTILNHDPALVVIIVLAIIGGVIAIIFQKFMIIVSTSFSGSWVVVSGLASLFAKQTSPTDIGMLIRSEGSSTYIILLIAIALGIAGMVVQYRSIPASKSNGAAV